MPCPFAIDTDPGIDDALALILAFRSPQISVELITTVAGNMPIGRVTDNARRLLALLCSDGKRPPIFRGAARPLVRQPIRAAHIHGDDGLGGLTRLLDSRNGPRYGTESIPIKRSGAVDALLECARLHSGRLNLVALGPLTNIAQAIERDRNTMLKIKRLVVMGGAICVGGNITPAAEFNFYADPDAAEQVLGAGLPVMLIPLDVTRQVRLTRELLARQLPRSQQALPYAIRQMTARLLRERGEVILHDPLAVAAAIDPSLVRTTAMRVWVECKGHHTLGASVADRRRTQNPAKVSKRPLVDVALEVDNARAIALFSQRVLRSRPGLPSNAPASRSRSPSRRSKPGVIVVGGANIDISISSDRLPVPGQTLEGGRLARHFGGKAANQAVAAARADAEVRLVTRLGNDADAGRYLAHLNDEGIDTQFVQLDTREPTGTALILLGAGGQNLICVAPGANARLNTRVLAGLKQDWPANTGVMLACMEASDRVLISAFALARQNGVCTVLNAAPARRLSPALERLIDVLVINEIEAQTLTGNTLTAHMPRQELIDALRVLTPPVVIVTLGEWGAVWVRRTAGKNMNQVEYGHSPAHRVEAIDTVGAGDTFLGYLCSALAQQQPLSDAIQLATEAATVSVTRHGAQAGIPRFKDVVRLRKLKSADAAR